MSCWRVLGTSRLDLLRSSPQYLLIYINLYVTRPSLNTPSMMIRSKYVLMFEPVTWQGYEIKPVSELF